MKVLNHQDRPQCPAERDMEFSFLILDARGSETGRGKHVVSWQLGMATGAVSNVAVCVGDQHVCEHATALPVFLHSLCCDCKMTPGHRVSPKTPSFCPTCVSMNLSPAAFLIVSPGIHGEVAAHGLWLCSTKFCRVDTAAPLTPSLWPSLATQSLRL